MDKVTSVESPPTLLRICSTSRTMSVAEASGWELSGGLPDLAELIISTGAGIWSPAATRL